MQLQRVIDVGPLFPQLLLGVMTGVAPCLWILVEFFLGWHNELIALSQWGDWLALLPTAAMLLGAMRYLKYEEYNGDFAWREAWLTGIRISLVASLIFALFLLIYQRAINPGWFPAQISHLRSSLTEAGASSRTVLEALQWRMLLAQWWVWLSFVFLLSWTIGVFVSLAWAYLLRTR
jgi:hypothetical protein